VRGSQQDPGWSVSRCAEREGLRPTAQTNPTKRTAGSPLERPSRSQITQAESTTSHRQSPPPLLCARAVLTDPGRGRTRASPHPLPRTRQTPIHPATDCQSAAAFGVGSSHFLISRRTWFQPQPPEDKHTRVLGGLLESGQLDCRGAHPRFYLLRKWPAIGEAAAHQS